MIYALRCYFVLKIFRNEFSKNFPATGPARSPRAPIRPSAARPRPKRRWSSSPRRRRAPPFSRSAANRGKTIRGEDGRAEARPSRSERAVAPVPLPLQLAARHAVGRIAACFIVACAGLVAWRSPVFPVADCRSCRQPSSLGRRGIRTRPTRGGRPPRRAARTPAWCRQAASGRSRIAACQEGLMSAWGPLCPSPA